MKRFRTLQIYFAMVMFIMGVMFMTGCGGSDEKALILAGQNPVAPGTCTEAGPAVISSNPTDGDVYVSIGTVGTFGKWITVNFSEVMNPSTIQSLEPGELLTFTLRVRNGAYVSGVVMMNAEYTTATFVTEQTLQTNTEYTATISKYAESALGTSLSCSYRWSFKTAPVPTVGQAPVNLGTASTYGIFASADAPITLQVNALVEGDVGLMDGLGECNGCEVPTTVTGTIHNGDTAAQQAQIDLTAAYNDAMARSTNRCTLAAPTDIAAPQGACTGYTNPPGSIGSTTFNTYLPGLYWSGTAIDLGVDKTIVLDAQGDSSAVFIFQSASYITTGTGSEVILTGNARAKNVFWLAGSATTLGVSSTFKGTVITGTEAATVNGGTVSDPTLVEGRLFSGGAAVTVNSDATVTVPAP